VAAFFVAVGTSVFCGLNVTEGGEDWGERIPLLPLIPPCSPIPPPEMSLHCCPMSAALEMTTRPSAPPAEFQFNGEEPRVAPEPENCAPNTSLDTANNAMDTVEDPATSRKKGSFYSNKKGNFYSLEWLNIAKFDTWCWVEEILNSIEFWRSSNWVGGALWTIKLLFRCGHHFTGGGSDDYQITNPKWKQVKAKKTECPCHIIIKVYPHTSTILGQYVIEHDHELGQANIRHTAVSCEAWEQVKTLLKCKINRWEVMSKPYLVQRWI